MSSTETELKKEFELERMILFSDAVFAIAITLLIIEIKFPDINKNASAEEIFNAFRPTIRSFVAFLISFFFIGVMWTRHLRLFKYLKTYDNGVIFRNLLLLVFIVCFPFTASGLVHITPRFFIPFFIYVVNLAGLFVSHALLCRYIFKIKPRLAIDGHEREKKYIMLRSYSFAVAIVITTLVMTVTACMFPNNFDNVGYSFFVLPIMVGIMRKRLKKYKPANLDEG